MFRLGEVASPEESPVLAPDTNGVGGNDGRIILGAGEIATL
ncbi:MAG: hypothetical protein NT069_04640 [Planctomycetota bacterium]|nr:hypothetical protein [Planctomycetota bacterium]